MATTPHGYRHACLEVIRRPDNTFWTAHAGEKGRKKKSNGLGQPGRALGSAHKSITHWAAKGNKTKKKETKKKRVLVSYNCWRQKVGDGSNLDDGKNLSERVSREIDRG